MSEPEAIMVHDPLADVAAKLESADTQEIPQAGNEAPAEASATGASGDDPAFVLPEQLGIQDVGELHKVLSDLLDAGAPIRLDAQGVEQVDGAGVQLLAVFFKEAVTHSIPVQWQAVSPTLARAADVLGMRELLGIDSMEVETA